MMTANSLRAVGAQLGDVGERVRSSTNVPASVKTQYDAFARDFETIGGKLGVSAAPSGAAAAAAAAAGAAGGRGAAGGGRGAGGAGGRGGGGAGGADTENVLGRAGTVKNSVMAEWQAPTPGMVRQYNEVRLALPRATTDGDALIVRARAIAASLDRYGVKLNVPPAR
jgi:hypothetical protein